MNLNLQQRPVLQMQIAQSKMVKNFLYPFPRGPATFHPIMVLGLGHKHKHQRTGLGLCFHSDSVWNWDFWKQTLRWKVACWQFTGRTWGGSVLSGSREERTTGQGRGRNQPTANRVVATETQAIWWGALKLGGPVRVVPNWEKRPGFLIPYQPITYLGEGSSSWSRAIPIEWPCCEPGAASVPSS